MIPRGPPRSDGRSPPLLETAIALEERRQRARAAAGRCRTGLTDLAARHDACLAETAGERPR